ncbi:AlkZ-related protein [Paenibacillus sp. sgz302251]|uniref:AlkZ-related protein n=1 Tax=Paenibacillus sp. sgz302251 TaxID=3414493 RepID=UPI003C7ADDA4
MNISIYPEFVHLVKQFKIFPFSDLIPEHPSLTAVVADNVWHTGTELDPWLWRVKIVQDEHAAYGKFFGSKLTFIQVGFFPSVQMLLSQGKSVEERYGSGLMSKDARNIFSIIKEAGRIDSRNLRKASGLTPKEQKKDYERALVELQNFADIVITGAQESDFDGGWSSMCFESAEHWLNVTLGRKPAAPDNLASAKAAVKAELSSVCTEKAMKYLDKKLKFNL